MFQSNLGSPIFINKQEDFFKLQRLLTLERPLWNFSHTCLKRKYILKKTLKFVEKNESNTQNPLKKSEVKNKLIDAIRYLTGTAPGMFHGYQMYYALKNFELRQNGPVVDLEKKVSFFVFVDQYFDQMQLCNAQGLLKKSPEIFNNDY